MKNFGLLVGNGFTLDYCKPHGLDSSSPLKNFKNIDIHYSNDFMMHLPNVKSKLIDSNLNDYCAIQNYINSFKHIEEEFRYHKQKKNYSVFKDPKYSVAMQLHVELRRFIAMAYSVLQLKLAQYDDIRNWKWVEWFIRNRDLLKFCISFNYDLVLEESLDTAQIKYYRVGTNETIRQIPVIKPHGSIDFDLNNLYILNNGSDYFWNLVATLNDTAAVEIIPKAKWLNPRNEADIILPSLHNFQIELSWIRRMFDQYLIFVKNLEAFVIIGCSYGEVDRPEIDFFLQHLNKDSIVYVIDPDPKVELKLKIQSLGLIYRESNESGFPW